MTYRTAHRLVDGLLAIGPKAIETENDVALERYFSPDFVFHGADGSRTDREGLKAYFAALRAAFPDLRFERREIVAADRHLAARTIVTGTFLGRFTASPVGPLEPTGRPVRWEVLSLMRFGEDDRALEEWVQTDSRSLIAALGAGTPATEGDGE